MWKADRFPTPQNFAVNLEMCSYQNEDATLKKKMSITKSAFNRQFFLPGFAAFSQD